MHAEEDAPLWPVPSVADTSPTAEGPAIEVAGYQPYEHMPGSLSTADPDVGEGRAARRRDASLTSSSIEDPARKDSAGAKRGSVHDATEKSIPASNVEPVQDVAETSARAKAESVQDAVEKDSVASNRESVQDVYKTSADTKGESLHIAAGKDIPASNVELLQDVDKTSPRTKRRSIPNAAETSPGSGRETVRNFTEKSSQRSSSGPAEDTIKTSASASDDGFIENTANQDDTEMPVAYESASMCLREQ